MKTLHTFTFRSLIAVLVAVVCLSNFLPAQASAPGAGNLAPDNPLVWNTFLGRGNWNEEGYDIAVDSSGNMYVAGTSDGTWGNPVRGYTGNNDAFVAKLDSSGDMVWNTFLGGSDYDIGKTVAVDGNGNVYVAGMSSSSWGSPKRAYSGGDDAFAAKLNASGELLWNTFLGSWDGSEEGSAIAVGGDGHVYIGGTSNNTWGSPVRNYTNGSDDAFAAKLDSSGNLAWNTFLGGDGHQYGQGIAVDGNNNVYVAGDSSATWENPVHDYNGGIYDAFAAKLDPTGNLTWNTFLGGSGDDTGFDVAVDNNGNVFISGQSDANWGSPVRTYTASYDFFAAKLDTSGTLTWNTFLGGDGIDFGGGIAVDSNGNVYVASVCDGTWGSPVRAFSNAADAFVAKLNSSGNLVWNTFLGGDDTDWGRNVAVDVNGNVYVVGYSLGEWGSPTHLPYGQEAFAARLDSSGNLTWNDFIGTGANDQGFGIATDNSGNIYVSGHSNGTWGNPIRAFTDNSDIIVAKLDSSGNPLWNTFLGGKGIDYGNAGIVVDTNGNIYVGGTSNSPWSCAPVNCTMRAYTGGDDAFIAKLDSSGNLIWNTFLGGVGAEFGGRMAVDSGGNIYIPGISDSTWGAPVRAYIGGSDAFAAKVNSSGNLIWNTFLGGAGEDGAGGIAVNDSGIVFVEGDSNINWGCSSTPCTVRAYTSGTDTFIARLDNSGSLIWNTFLGGSGEEYAQGAIALDNVGNIYESGFCDNTWGIPVRAFTTGDSDAFVAKVNSSGDLAWNTFLGGSGEDLGRGIVVDALGSIHIVGISYEGWGTPLEAYHGADDAFVARLDSSGSLNALTFLGGSDSDWGRGIAEDSNGYLYITGRSFSTWGTPVNGYSGGPDIFAAKVAFPPAVVSINRASPNPTNSASVDFTVTFSKSVYGVDTSDFTLTLNGISAAYVQAVNGSGATRTVTVYTGTGSGTLRLDVVDDDTIIDGDSNPLGGVGANNGNFISGQTYTVRSYTLFLPLILR